MPLTFYPGALKKRKSNGTYEDVVPGVITAVDNELSSISESPVQNKVVTVALNGKVDSSDYDPVSKTPAMKKPVGKDSNGTLWTEGMQVIYGFHIDSSESDPSAAVIYLADACGMTPAAMNYTSGAFNYGSWQDAFFLPRPCMLKYDGTVDYYLDENDYSKKEDGTASDVADVSYGGNAMMEWGKDGKIIWYKVVPDASDPTSVSVYITDHQADSDYVCWPFVNNQGDIVDHFYTPIYNGFIDGNGRLRSLSGIAAANICQNKTAAQEITAAELNNPSTDKLWYTEVFSDITLENYLLVLMGKSLNAQTVYGNGRINNSSNMIGTGTMNARGLFWGGNGNNDGVKVFGMENRWGNQWHRYAGHLYVERVHKYKLTRGTQDGSSASDYNTDGTGYLTGPTGLSENNYVTAFAYTADGGMFTKTVGGTGSGSSTYYCDYFYQNTGTRYALRGGCSDSSLGAGPFYVALGYDPGRASWNIGAAPSCKPLP